MTGVDQTRFGDTGNCLQASVATITGLPLARVPHFAGKNWLWDLMTFCRNQGWSCRYTRNTTLILLHKGHAVVQGQSPRGRKHAVVFFGGNMLHDPHPSRAGIQDIQDAILFTR